LSSSLRAAQKRRANDLADQHASAVARIIDSGRRDPVGFIEGVLGSPLWARQREIVETVWTHQRTAIKAAHGVGKTYVAANLALAWHYLYPRSRVITTAPTWSQVSKLLWAEIAKTHKRLPPTMGGTLLGTELKSGPSHFVLGLSTDEADRFQGHHSERILLILDEGPGVRPEIWEAAFSLMAVGDARLLAIGNPTETAGPFYEAFTSQRDRWGCMTISAFDTPNLLPISTDPETGQRRPDEETLDRLMSLSPEELADNPMPFLTTRGWVKEAAFEYEVGSPAWSSRVLGDFPVEGDNSLLPLSWVERAAERGENPASTDEWLRSLPEDDAAHCDDPDLWQIGVDVAGPGTDETVVCVRNGRRIVEIKAWSGRDARGDVLAAIEPYRDREPLVCVDNVGIGYYFAQTIRDAGWTVSEINVGRPAVDKARFQNWKAELFWNLRGLLQRNAIDVPQDRKLVSQASAIRYRYSPQGKVMVESKDEIAKRGGRSPDRLEALMLSCARSNRLSLTRKTLSQEIVL
tara:strand:+ start:437 stop:1996 length:1560 start_codon:yes stop_codon:yes gene_type:complete